MPVRCEDLAIAPKIGQVSELTGLTRRAVRYYEILGLIEPHRDQSGQRRYSKESQLALGVIMKLRRAGLSVSDIREVLNASPRPAQTSLAVAKLRARLDQLDCAQRQVQSTINAVTAGALKLAPSFSPDQRGDAFKLRRA